jgi:MFS superfamily sulfate permease-like transporter
VANLGTGLAAGMFVNGSPSKTAVNGSAGARSQISGLTVAALTVVTLLFLTGLFEQLPEATLAAVVIAAVIELVDIPAMLGLHFRAFVAVRRTLRQQERVAAPVRRSRSRKQRGATPS